MKKLPSVEKVLEEECVSLAVNAFSRGGIIRLIRDSIGRYREALLNGEKDASGEEILAGIAGEVAGEIRRIGSSVQRRVINATGVVLHTNLGRAPLGQSLLGEILTLQSGYTDLEVDTATGERTHRERRAARLLSLITGAESALVVNNTAAAILLAVDTFAGGGAVAVSRGELVEIGGSFRLPEILRKGAGRVMEIGTTNRTNLKDYEKAIDDGATMLLKVHTSNYRIVGYTDDVPLARLAALGRERDVPVMYDQGSGVLFPLGSEGITGEEDIASLLSSGVDMMAFSGDKVLGGPQSGIVIGSERHIGKMRGNHLARALRVDKLTLACLEETLCRYWRGEARDIPALRMILSGSDVSKKRAEAFAADLEKVLPEGARVTLSEGESSIGGGSFPATPLPATIIELGL
ncbi:MAG TPA: L-seryl-tRNA(Sec) selenium transferase, partial [Candidatus Krumholzibacterium sp.]|nr:L-seryl-tRNA(Sec) selenium transferase [Candidatus Krumholzibacterium sp.]